MSDGKKKAPKSVDGLYQKFIEFLNSPVWSLPVVSFIEQRSIVFDKEQGDEKLYKQIHNEFRSMVDMLIECFCDDSGVKPTQLTQALKSDKAKNRSQLEQSVLEPVIAAQDYSVFVHMMTRKNIELQLQALQMIEFMCGLIPAVLMPLKGGDGAEQKAGSKEKGEQPQNEEQERMILIQVMKQSKAEYDKEQTQRTQAQKELEDAMKQSLAERTRLEEARKEQDQMVQQAMQLNLGDDSSAEEKTEQKDTKRPASAAKGKTKTSEKKQKEEEEAPEQPSAKTAADIRAMLKEKAPIPGGSIEARQAYLRDQRDKLLAMKREARQKAFADQESEAKRQRPKTAQAVKSALRGNPMPQPKISQDVLEARKALALKLKQEVINKN